MNRKRLPDTRRAITHKLKLENKNIYFRIGLYEDSTPGEVFIIIDQDESGLGCAYNCLGIAISMLLQTGWTIDDLHKKFSFVKGEPSGFTRNEQVPNANSIVDYLVRYMKSDSFIKKCQKGINHD